MLTFIEHAIVLVMFAVSLGGLTYYLLAIAATYRFWKRHEELPVEQRVQPPMSLLKPLGGADLGLEQHLKSFFCQKYPSFEILFAVRSQQDPAVPIVRDLMARYPGIPAQLIVTGDPPYANAKVFSMQKMA